MADLKKLENAMCDLEEEIVLDIIKEIMADGGKDASAAMEACSQGMNIVGERFEQGEYFVSDLIFAGEIMTEAVNQLSPALVSQGESKANQKMIIGTVKDDLHDIGKNIVKAFFEAAGFEVIDLGIDVPASEFVKVSKEQGINIVALSGVLTLALDSMKGVVDAFVAAGTRDNVKILIGGNPVSEESCKIIGADAWSHSPQDSINICKKWLAGTVTV